MILQPSEKPSSAKIQQVHNVHRASPITAMHMVHVQSNGEAVFDTASKAPEPKDYSQDPPPYTVGPSRPSVLHQPLPQLPVQRLPPPLPPRGSSPKPATRATNHVFIRSKHDAVRGFYELDPQLETIALDKRGATAIDRAEFMQKNRQRHRHHQRKAFRKQKNLPIPSAIFGSKDAPVNVDVSLVSPPGELTVRKTLVQTTTKQGDIDIRVRHIDPRRRLNLEVATRKGTIVVLLPRSYSGYIQIFNKRGRTAFLSAINASTHLVAQNERETQVVVGDARYATPAKGAEWDGDTIHIASRNGDVYIGYIGEDSKPVTPPTLWEKFTKIISGAKAISDVRAAMSPPGR